MQASLLWNQFMDFLTVLSDSTTMLAIHLSDNGFVSYMDTVLMKYPNRPESLNHACDDHKDEHIPLDSVLEI